MDGSILVEADDVNWARKRPAPKQPGRRGGWSANKGQSDGFIRESGSSAADIQAWRQKQDDDEPAHFGGYGSVVTKASVRKKGASRTGPSLLATLGARPHVTRDAASRFNDARKGKAPAAARPARPIYVERSPGPAAPSPPPAAASAYDW